jgi:signal transduction histidine kinase
MTDNSRDGSLATGRSIALEAETGEALRQTIDRLSLEIGELRASRRRLVRAADADRSVLERELHERVQQDLAALAVNLQLATQLHEDDPAAARELLAAMQRDVQQALVDAAELAARIHPPLLQAGGLAAALRSAAASAGIRAAVEVAAGASYPAEVVASLYWCCLDALEQAGAGAGATVRVSEEDGAIVFEVAADRRVSDAGVQRLRDRVEGLGGRLTVEAEPGGGTWVSGSLPVAG